MTRLESFDYIETVAQEACLNKREKRLHTGAWFLDPTGKMRPFVEDHIEMFDPETCIRFDAGEAIPFLSEQAREAAQAVLDFEEIPEA